MSDHYYSNHPQSEVITETKEYRLRHHTLKLTSGTGVFSKKGIDFGSQVLMETFEPPSISGDFLDLGCGYGPIGLTIAKEFTDRHIYMVDVNERAIQFAKENAKQNNISNVTIQQSDGFETISQKRFASIITNPPIRAGKKVIFSFFEKSFEQLDDGGELWVVIQKKQGAPSTIKYLETMFQQVDVVAKKKGYFIIRAHKGKLD